MKAERFRDVPRSCTCKWRWSEPDQAWVRIGVATFLCLAHPVAGR